MRFCKRNVRSFYDVGAIKSVVVELEKYKLDLVWVQGIMWEMEGYQGADNYTFSYEKGNFTTKLETDIFVYNRLISSLKRVESVNDGM